MENPPYFLYSEYTASIFKNGCFFHCHVSFFCILGVILPSCNRDHNKPLIFGSIYEPITVFHGMLVGFKH